MAINQPPRESRGILKKKGDKNDLGITLTPERFSKLLKSIICYCCCQNHWPIIGYQYEGIGILLLIHQQNIPMASLFPWAEQAEVLCNKVTEITKQNSRADFSLHYLLPGALSTFTIIVLGLSFLILMSADAQTEFISFHLVQYLLTLFVSTPLLRKLNF